MLRFHEDVDSGGGDGVLSALRSGFQVFRISTPILTQVRHSTNIQSGNREHTLKLDQHQQYILAHLFFSHQDIQHWHEGGLVRESVGRAKVAPIVEGSRPPKGACQMHSTLSHVTPSLWENVLSIRSLVKQFPDGPDTA